MTAYEPGSRVRVTLEATFLHDSTDFNGLLYVTNDQGGTHSIPQVQTIELVAPPIRHRKPAEPTGRYAVVEDSQGSEWVLADPASTPQPWKCLTRDQWASYDDIDVVEVHTKGRSA